MDRKERIASNLKEVQAKIDAAERISGRRKGSVRLIAVTKRRPVEDIETLASLGVREVGESRMQEALIKKGELSSSGLIWHFIGSLQRKKARKAVQEFDLIHSIDSLALAESVALAASGGSVSVLLQVNPLQEPMKHGVSLQEVEPTLEKMARMSSLKVCGLMAMAPLRGSLFPNDVEEAFSSMELLFHRMKEHFSSSLPAFHELSMGMSQDFEEAIQHGATLVRIGSLLFQGVETKVRLAGLCTFE